MIIIQLDSEQLNSVIQNAVRKVLKETPPQYASTSQPIKEVLTIDEAASLLNLDRQTIHLFICNHTIPFFRRSRKILFKRAELLKWIDKVKQKSVAEMQEETDDYLRLPIKP